MWLLRPLRVKSSISGVYRLFSPQRREERKEKEYWFFSNIVGEKDLRIQGVKESRVFKTRIAKELDPLFKRGISAILHDRIGPVLS